MFKKLLALYIFSSVLPVSVVASASSVHEKSEESASAEVVRVKRNKRDRLLVDVTLPAQPIFESSDLTQEDVRNLKLSLESLYDIGSDKTSSVITQAGLCVEPIKHYQFALLKRGFDMIFYLQDKNRLEELVGLKKHFNHALVQCPSQERYLVLNRMYIDLHNKIKYLTENSKQLTENSEQLAEYLKQLIQNSEQLAEYSKQLSENSERLAENSERLAEYTAKKNTVERLHNIFINKDPQYVVESNILKQSFTNKK